MPRLNYFPGLVQVGSGALVVCALLLPGAVSASDSQEVKVSATILKRATLKVLSQPSAVMVTHADLARGYVDVPMPARLAVQTNSRDGYLLEFASAGTFMRQILVKGLANDLQLNPVGGAVMVPASSSGGLTRATLALGFRILLAAGTQEGAYPWPLRISVAPV